MYVCVEHDEHCNILTNHPLCPIRHKVTDLLWGIRFAREYDAPEYHGYFVTHTYTRVGI